MKRKILTCLSALLVLGAAHASTHCDGYEIKLKNNLSEGLFVNKVQLIGADIQPRTIGKIDAKSEVVFTVNNSSKKMNAEFEFRTISIPSKTLKIRFDLSNALLRCTFDDKTSDSDKDGIQIKNDHSSSHVSYTIG